MNPSLQNIDPTLKETYDKVMATQLPGQPSSQPKVIEPTPSSPPAGVQADAQQSKPATAQTSQVFVASPTTPTGVKKAGKKVSPIVLGVVTFVFFAIYAVVWLKVFGVF